MIIPAYPLAWPAGWKRTAPQDRDRAKFGRSEMKASSYNPSLTYRTKREITVADGVGRILAELSRFGVPREDVIISTNLQLRQDGLPYSNRRAPEDPGVAVYWKDPDLGAQCMAADQYDTVAGNLGAIAATIEAMRTIHRHGGMQILRRAFQGFKALPATTGGVSPHIKAHEIISVASGIVLPVTDLTVESARDAVRRARANSHPDRTGSDAQFLQVQEAAKIISAQLGVSL